LLVELIIILALIAANGLFAGAEMALVSLRPTRVDELVAQHRAGARTVAALRAEPERLLATIQIGITVISTTAAAFGGSTIAVHLEPLFVRMGLGRHADDVAFGVVIAGLSYLSLVLGELVPKSLGLRAAERYALFAAKPLWAIARATRPIVWLLTTSSNILLRPFRDRTTFVESRISVSELQQMVSNAAEAGDVHEHAGELAARALKLDKLQLYEAMVPRAQIDALPFDAPPERVRDFLLERLRSRIPVYAGTLDHIVGYISAKDFITLAWEGQLVVLADLLRPIKLFPETVLAAEVLRFMRDEHQHIALAVDTHGAISGLVTLEDLMETIVGDVFSEHDVQRGMPVEPASPAEPAQPDPTREAQERLTRPR
jgi:putative hemolysin